METKDNEFQLQDWQEQILSMYNPIELKPQQKRMIKTLLFPSDSNPFHVEEEYKRILERVLSFGYYREEDREALNYAREGYLKGRNWIK
jgi:hypothetical protein